MNLQDELAKVEARLQRRTSLSGTETNPAGDIGGIRSRSQKRKNQLFDRWSREAKEQIALEAERDRLRAKITHTEQAPAREARDRRLLAAWDALKPGDTFTPGNNPITIKRKNAWSVTDTNDVRWSITEVIGLSRKEAEALQEALS